MIMMAMLTMIMIMITNTHHVSVYSKIECDPKVITVIMGDIP